MSSNERRKRKIGNLAMIVTAEVDPALTIAASEGLQALPEAVEAVTSAAAVALKGVKEAEKISEEAVVVVATDSIAQAGIAEVRDTEKL
jgi:hypothetical protein